MDDPDYWRFRADHARQMAQDMKQGEAKAIVLKIAEEYELVARLTEDLRTSTARNVAWLRDEEANHLVCGLENTRGFSV